MSESSRNGKIARCPPAIREEVCQRLHAGESGPKIIAWLHTQEAVLSVLDEYFNEQPINAQNLTEWRQGGYGDWLKRREQLENTKQLATFASELASKGQGIGAGNVAIAGGQLLQIFESLDIEAQKTLLVTKPETYIDLLSALAKIEKSQADRIKAEAGREMVEISRQRAEQAETKLKLELDKFARTTCELYLKWYDDQRAKEVVTSGAPRAEQIERLRQLMFPDLEPLDPTPLNPD